MSLATQLDCWKVETPAARVFFDFCTSLGIEINWDDFLRELYKTPSESDKKQPQLGLPPIDELPKDPTEINPKIVKYLVDNFQDFVENNWIRLVFF